MHPLLLPYAALSALLLAHAGGGSRAARAGVWAAGWAAVALVLGAAAFREVHGDTAAYHRHFLAIRELGLVEAVRASGQPPLYAAFNWALGLLGGDVRILTVGVAAAILAVTAWSLRALLTPLQTAILLFVLSAYPFFVAYVANAMKQGLALAFLLAGYILIQRGRRAGWGLVLLAPLWHVAAWLALPFLAWHLIAWRLLAPRRALALQLGCLAAATLLSLSGLNGLLAGPLAERAALAPEHRIYLMDPALFGYRAGFRLDFALFTLIPVASYAALRLAGGPLTPEASGWWLSLYASLASIYHIFSFAPFADRFAGFAWHILPLVLFVQCLECRSPRILAAFVAGAALLNTLLIGTYSGKWISL